MSITFLGNESQGPLGVFLNELRCSVSDSDCWEVGVGGDLVRKHRGVDNAQVTNAVHAMEVLRTLN